MQHGLTGHHDLMPDHLTGRELRFGGGQGQLLLLLLLLSLLLSLLILQHVKLRLLLQLAVLFRFA